MSHSAIVRTEGVRKTYGYNNEIVEAVKGIDLTVTKGEFLAIAGPSGSGKTTLLNLIGCLDTPSEGKVYVEDRDLSVFSKRRLSDLRLNRIGFIFQEFNLIPVLTSVENVEYVMLLQGRDGETRRRRALDMLADVGLSGMEHRTPNRLSGGQQQRVAIARAIASDPVIVLADEPTANLDSKTGRSLLELMRKINREKGVTFLFSTHDPMVMETADRIVYLRDGTVERDERKR